MKYIREKSGDVNLDLKGVITLKEGDEVICETNEPKVFFGSWENKDEDINELPKRGNKYDRKLREDKNKVGWHEPTTPQGSAGRICKYCGKPLGDNARPDKLFCNKRCRQNYNYHVKKPLREGKDRPKKLAGEPLAKGVEKIK